MYNVTLRRVRVTTVVRGKQSVSNIMTACLHSFLRNPVNKSHLSCIVLSCHLWPVWKYDIFPLYLINSTIVGKKIEQRICVLKFYTNFT